MVALDERQHFEEGIKLDLEWMHRVGIAGFQNFDAALIDATGSAQPAGVYDSGVEGLIPIRDRNCRSIGNGRGDCGIAGVE